MNPAALLAMCVMLVISAACAGFLLGWVVWAIVSGLLGVNTRRQRWEDWGHAFGIVGAALIAIKVGYMLDAAL